ncbi:MAG TPA: type II toxin-antitoxin system HicB family antitoxin [Planctomycetales bacterium]|jgi:predicted RNase H-like HicB family nuclease|nr:type II toxin-antitoxin system HicB family antitoxin [Planctomycetales bacterium]
MKLQVVIHPAEEGGFWAEVPGFPGCVSCGDTLDETRANIRDAFEGVFEVMQETAEPDPEFQTPQDQTETLQV